MASIAIDVETKERAAKRARKERMPLASVVRVLLTEYADGKLSIGVRTEPSIHAEEVPVDSATRKKMDTIVDMWRGTMRP